MSGDLIIDGIDVFDTYGIGIEHKGCNGLVAFNSLREPDRNDWPEEDGIEVDLSDPKLQGKNFTILFHGLREFSVEDFINFLDEEVYHVFEFRKLGITRKLRLTSMPSRRTIQPLKTFDIEFSDDDNPFDGYVRQDPIHLEDNLQTGIEIDGRPFSDYGVSVNYGLLDEILTQPAVKLNLTVDNEAIDGRVYDDGADVVFSSRDVVVKCTLKCDKETFWRNWMALFYDLTRPGERMFYWDSREMEYPCYYKSCAVDRFYIDRNGYIWCDFSITLCFTILNIGDTWYLLAVTPQGIIELDDTGLMIDMTINPQLNPS